MDRFKFDVGNIAPKRSEWQTWTVVQVPRTGHIKVWPIVPVLWSIRVHFVGGTKVCMGENCPHCASRVPWRTAYYVPALRTQAPANVVMQVTQELASQIEAMLPREQLLSRSAITLARSAPSRYSPTKLIAVEKSTLPEKTHSIDGSVESVLNLIGVPKDEIVGLAKVIYDAITARADDARAAARSAAPPIATKITKAIDEATKA